MDKKQLIIKAAIRVFARDGLEKGKIADIAKEAGIGKGTIYEYFRSKDEIFQAIEQLVFTDFGYVFVELNSLSLSPTEKLKYLMNKGLDMLMEMGDAMLIITELWAQAVRGHVLGTHPMNLMDFYEEYRVGVESILKAGIQSNEFRDINPEGIARILMAFMDGLVWQFAMLNDPVKFEKVKTVTIQSFMEGILK